MSYPTTTIKYTFDTQPGDTAPITTTLDPRPRDDDHDKDPDRDHDEDPGGVPAETPAVRGPGEVTSSNLADALVVIAETFLATATSRTAPRSASAPPR
jgi:hypothetical protein